MVLDAYLPAYDRREVHRRRCTDAPSALGAVREVTPGEIRGFGVLMGVRLLAASAGVGGHSDSVWEIGLRTGFRVFDESSGVLIGGAIGQFWRLRGGTWATFEGVDGFRAFDRPGFVKTVIGFWVDGDDLVTETRVVGTDPLSARRMARYWLLIRPGSGFIRRGWLRAANKRSKA